MERLTATCKFLSCDPRGARQGPLPCRAAAVPPASGPDPGLSTTRAEVMPLPNSLQVGRVACSEASAASQKGGRRDWPAAASLARQTSIDSRFASFVRISNLFVTADAGVKLLHPVYANRQTKRFAGQRIAASIDGLRSLARLAGISKKST